MILAEFGTSVAVNETDRFSRFYFNFTSERSSQSSRPGAPLKRLLVVRRRLPDGLRILCDGWFWKKNLLRSCRWPNFTWKQIHNEVRDLLKVCGVPPPLLSLAFIWKGKSAGLNSTRRKAHQHLHKHQTALKIEPSHLKSGEFWILIGPS